MDLLDYYLMFCKRADEPSTGETATDAPKYTPRPELVPLEFVGSAAKPTVGDYDRTPRQDPPMGRMEIPSLTGRRPVPKHVSDLITNVNQFRTRSAPDYPIGKSFGHARSLDNYLGSFTGPVAGSPYGPARAAERFLHNDPGGGALAGIQVGDLIMSPPRGAPSHAVNDLVMGIPFQQRVSSPGAWDIFRQQAGDYRVPIYVDARRGTAARGAWPVIPFRSARRFITMTPTNGAMPYGVAASHELSHLDQTDPNLPFTNAAQRARSSSESFEEFVPSLVDIPNIVEAARRDGHRWPFDTTIRFPSGAEVDVDALHGDAVRAGLYKGRDPYELLNSPAGRSWLHRLLLNRSHQQGPQPSVQYRPSRFPEFSPRTRQFMKDLGL